MIKKLLLIAVVALLIVPSLAKAEEDEEVISTCLEITYTLGYRSADLKTNGQVSDVQDFLIASGYLDGQTSGYFGIKTVNAVKKFQAASGIKPTGSIGALTKAKIKTISCGLSNFDGSNVTSPMPQPAPAVNSPAQSAENAALRAQLQALQGQLADQAKTNSNPTQPSTVDRDASLKALQASLAAEQARLAAERAKQESLNRDAQIKALQDRLAQEQSKLKSEPYIRITSPNTGERWTAGNQYTVRWSSGNLSEYEPNGTFYFQGASNGSMCAIGQGAMSNGSMTVNLASPFTCAYGPSSNTLADGNYRIVVFVDNASSMSKPQAKGASGEISVGGTTAQPSISMISPVGGEVYHTGYDYQINWKSNGVKQVNIYACYPDGQGTNCSILNDGWSFKAYRLNASSGNYNFHINTSYPNETAGSESTFYPYYDKSVQIKVSDADHSNISSEGVNVSIPGEVGSLNKSSQIADIASAIAALQEQIRAAQAANNR